MENSSTKLENNSKNSPELNKSYQGKEIFNQSGTPTYNLNKPSTGSEIKS